MVAAAAVADLAMVAIRGRKAATNASSGGESDERVPAVLVSLVSGDDGCGTRCAKLEWRASRLVRVRDESSNELIDASGAQHTISHERAARADLSPRVANRGGRSGDGNSGVLLRESTGGMHHSSERRRASSGDRSVSLSRGLLVTLGSSPSQNQPLLSSPLAFLSPLLPPCAVSSTRFGSSRIALLANRDSDERPNRTQFDRRER